MINTDKCSNCGSQLPENIPSNSLSNLISLGYCCSCARVLQVMLGVPLDEYIEGFSIPIVSVDRNGKIISANKIALDVLGKSSQEILGNQDCRVFECVYVSLPEGCGRELHCSGCTIRSVVLHTIATGMPTMNVPAFIENKANMQDCMLELMVSTFKKAGLIFLRVDKMKPAPCKGNLQ